MDPQSVADPGFPIRGCLPVWGGADLRCGHFSAEVYAKMKELDLIGGVEWLGTGAAPWIHH